METINVFDYEALARSKLDPLVWDYYEGGSDDEVTLRANRAAFERLRLRPRVLVDVKSCTMETTVLGIPVSMPVLIAPTAYQGLAHPEGECATAQGAGMANTLMIASTAANRSLEEIAQAASGPLWFQFYIFLEQDFQFSAKLIQRAEAAGYRAIVLTVDSPRLGNREKDIRHDLVMPPPPLKSANFVGLNLDMALHYPSLTWDSISWLRSLTSLPLVLKGILTAEDAALAAEHKVDAIIVSNHGGRQLDSVLTTIEALPEVVEAVAGRCEVYVDGGIRRGTDILKALALGARAVLVGRPTLWGLTADGAQGVWQVLEILRRELELAMALAGRPTLASIDRSLVQLQPTF